MPIDFVINVKGNTETEKTIVKISKNSVSKIANQTKSALVIDTPKGKAAVSNEALREMAAAAQGSTIEIIIASEKADEKTGKILGENAAVTEVTAVSDGREIHSFGGHSITITLKVPENLRDREIAALYISEDGKLEKLAGSYTSGNKEYSFTVNHLSHFALAEKSKADEAIKLQSSDKNAKIREGVKNTKLTASSKKVKGGIRVTWKKTPGYRLDGYEVHRSTQRYSGFGKKPYFKTKNTAYKNTKELKKGRRYYYKVRGYRIIDGEKVYTDWSSKAFRVY